MDTTVRVRTAVDLGAGEQTQITFPDSRFSTDQAGNLTVYVDPRTRDAEDGGSILFHHDLWWFVQRGELTFRSGGREAELVRRVRA